MFPVARAYACVSAFQVHPTAGTVFHKSTTSLETWFHAIYLMRDDVHRHGISDKSWNWGAVGARPVAKNSLLISTRFMHDSCMATKTITLELDAYEKLRSSKRPGESFSAVVRRAAFEQAPVTGTSLLDYFRAGGSSVSFDYLDAVEAAIKHDAPPENPWA